MKCKAMKHTIGTHELDPTEFHPNFSFKENKSRLVIAILR